MKNLAFTLYIGVFIFTCNVNSWAARLSGNTNERVFVNTAVGSSTTNYTVSETDGFLYIRDLVTGDNVTVGIVNESSDEQAAIFSAQIVTSGTYTYIPMSGASTGIRFTPLEAKTYRATLTVYVNGTALTPSIPLSGTGIGYPIVNFESAVSIDSSSVKRIAVAGLANSITPEQVGITDDAAGVFSIVDAKHYDTGDSVDVRFTPKDAIVYTAYLAVENNRKVALTAIGQNPAFYSVAGKEIWQYLQFVSTGKVITQNGTGNPLTANARVENNDAQLWKAIPSSTLSMDLLINKADPTLSIRFRDNRYVAVSGQVEPDPIYVPDDAVFLYLTNGQYTTNYASLTRIGDLHEPLEASAARPESNNEGAVILMNEREGGKNTPETYLRFVYHSGKTANSLDVIAGKVKIYPNPASEILLVEIPDKAVSLSVVNAFGQTLLTIKPTTTRVQLPVSHLNTGIYFLKIENTDKTRTIKFIKK
ncbi:MAG: T9SS type A sorting domain-containing protein [Dysgonamonadaceae bacterium]|jgi:hypothetical protein|nr:T9SS type A sorting domain-containing protein [Dysgonamonadaceae bacterium]